MDRLLVPIGTEIECYHNWLKEGESDTPVYSGGPEDAFMSLEPGLYPGSYVVWDVDHADGPRSVQINVLLVVTEDESFAVTTTQSYTGPMPVCPHEGAI